MNKLAIEVCGQSVFDFIVKNPKMFAISMTKLVMSVEPKDSQHYAMCDNFTICYTGHKNLPVEHVNVVFKSSAGEHAFDALMMTKNLLTVTDTTLTEEEVIHSAVSSGCMAINNLSFMSRLYFIESYELSKINKINGGTGNE